MRINTLKELLNDLVLHLYDAENQMAKALPHFMKAVSSVKLRNNLEDYLKKTTAQIGRLEEVCAILGAKPGAKHCIAAEALLKEADEVITSGGEVHVRDAGLISALQREAHYELAMYGTARSYAELLGMPQVAKLLQETLTEEKSFNKALIQLARSEVNRDAAGIPLVEAAVA